MMLPIALDSFPPKQVGAYNYLFYKRISSLSSTVLRLGDYVKLRIFLPHITIIGILLPRGLITTTWRQTTTLSLVSSAFTIPQILVFTHGGAQTQISRATGQ